MCVQLCTTVIHNAAQNSSDNIPSYPPENHHSSDDVYWKGGEDRFHYVIMDTTPPPQPFYGPFSGTTRVSQCQKRTGLYGARGD